MISDLANNPIDPSAISFSAFRTTEAEVFPHDIYMMLIQSLRDSDQVDGGELILRWLAAAQSEFEDTYERIQSLRRLYDVERTSLAALRHVKWLVGLTSSLDYLTSGLSEAELRRLVSLAVRTWKTKGTEAGIQAVLEAVTVGEIRIVNYFLFRTLIDVMELGHEEVPGVDAWLIDEPGMSPSVEPDGVTVSSGVIRLDVSPLLGSAEAVPHDVRVRCVLTRVTATVRSFWDQDGANLVDIPSVALGLTPGDEPTGVEDYKVGVDPPEYCSDLRIADNGGLNRSLVEGLVRVLRSSNERVFIRYVTFLDSFRRTFDWILVSGTATANREEGLVRVGSTLAASAIRVDRDGADAWDNYHVLARVRLERNTLNLGAEVRFYYQNESNFYALRLVPSGGIHGTLKVDRVLLGARTSLLTVNLPVLHLGVDYTLTADVIPADAGGNLIKVALDGNRMGSCTDAALVSGRLALGADMGQMITCTYIEMFRHPLETVRIGPEMSIGQLMSVPE